MSSRSVSPTAVSAEKWQEIVAEYQKPDLGRSLRQAATSYVPYFGLLAAMYWSLDRSYWLTLALSVVAGGFLVRIFIILHDCSHGSFFRSRRANDLVGLATGVLLFTPFYEWRRRHAIHHAGSSDLGRRGWWDFETLTVAEYTRLSPWRRLRYRLYRHPLVLLGLGPLVFFLFIQRFSAPGAARRQKLCVRLTNAAILSLVALALWLTGPRQYLLMQLPALWVAATTGMWLFYVQHQFEETYWAEARSWDFVTAALEGSSYYRLPRPLQWFTGNIGFHHIHHLSARIPNYHLPRCHEENADFFRQVTTLTLGSSLRALSVRLWDEEARRMVGFRAIRARNPDGVRLAAAQAYGSGK